MPLPTLHLGPLCFPTAAGDHGAAPTPSRPAPRAASSPRPDSIKAAKTRGPLRLHACFLFPKGDALGVGRGRGRAGGAGRSCGLVGGAKRGGRHSVGFVGSASFLWVESRECIVLWVKPRRGRLSPGLAGKGPSGRGPDLVALWTGPKPHTGVFRESACQTWGRCCPRGSIWARRAGPGADCTSGDALLGKRGLSSELFSGEWEEPGGGGELSSRRVGGVQVRWPLEAKWAWSRLMGGALKRSS